ncbi:hypothetical protein GQE99_06550 [Maritimibacter sp. DP07]|uniref:Uncharacterized protein n=1 Tax=Maritimibacter harenae TaxID=2606218 RepID=A0A845M0X7_9RHOB|nr:hypothetical protein [Maritimibacter harenae]MZR12679.1 hypothetical protein [Maritimibacter harenae]
MTIGDTINDLIQRDCDALAGRLTLRDWNEIGMRLFSKGIVTLDPLIDATDTTTPYGLTETGRQIAIILRQDAA